MSTQNIKLRARKKKDRVAVKAIIKHPMETGLRKDKVTGFLIPAHHIIEVSCHRENDLLFSTYWGPGVSKDPFISFNLRGIEKGEILTLSYIDNKGQTGSLNTTVR